MNPSPSIAVVFLCAAAACASPEGKPPAATAEPQRPGPEALAAERRGPEHLLVTFELEGDALRVVDARRVPAPLPVLRGQPPGRWMVEVRSGDGALLHAARLNVPTEVRGEFAREDGSMESHRVQLEKAAFSVRLPVLPEGRELRVLAPGDRARERQGVEGVEGAHGLRRVGSVPYPEAGR